MFRCLYDDWKTSFLPLLIFDWWAFSRRITARWWHQSAKNQVSTNQNSRNRWCLIVRRSTRKFLLRQLMTSSRRKRGEDGNTKNWISREGKELFRWNKKHFSWLFRDYHLAKKWKIAGTSFKDSQDDHTRVLDKVMSYSAPRIWVG